jgi:hypothetical protein
MPAAPSTPAADSTAIPPATAPAETVAGLAWLAGCWERVAGDRRVEEQWMTPRGGTMLGMSRTIAGGVTREYEHLLIGEEDGSLVYTARPSGQAEASFRSILVTSERVVFENAAHDFPQRIIYIRAGADSLVARIEGEHSGEERHVDFPMRRCPCAGGAGER